MIFVGANSYHCAMRNRYKSFVKLAACAGGVGLAGVCLALGSATAPATRQAAGDLPPEQLAALRKPISYFNQKCANCHGDYGNYWGDGFAADKDDKQLREAVEGMCNGPAQATLDARPLEAQVAYNRSFKTKMPFATAYRTDAGTLGGEVTPGATVTLTVDGQSVPAKVDGHKWTSDAQSAEAVAVEKGGKTTTLKPDGDGVAFPAAAKAK